MLLKKKWKYMSGVWIVCEEIDGWMFKVLFYGILVDEKKRFEWFVFICIVFMGIGNFFF